MSLHPEPIGEIPAETARVARAAFPKGTLVTRLRDEFSIIYQDEDFGRLYPSQGQPALAPWRLALVTVFQFLENLSDRQAADAVRARIDWKYALGLELTDPGFHFSVLTEFRARLVAGNAEHLLLDRMLERFKTRGLVKARGKQRTDSTHVLAAVHDLHLLELVGETLRATLDDLAAARAGLAARRSRRRPGSSAMRAASRSTACPGAERRGRRSPSRLARTASSSSRRSMRPPRRQRPVRCRWCGRCARSGGCITPAATTASCVGGRSRSCRRWRSACSRRMIRRRTSA